MDKKWLWFLGGAAALYFIFKKKNNSPTPTNIGVLSQPEPNKMVPYEAEANFIPEVEREFATEQPSTENEPVSYEIEQAEDDGVSEYQCEDIDSEENTIGEDTEEVQDATEEITSNQGNTPVEEPVASQQKEILVRPSQIRSNIRNVTRIQPKTISKTGPQSIKIIKPTVSRDSGRSD